MRAVILSILVLPIAVAAGTSRFFTFSAYDDWADGEADGVEIWAPGGIAAAAALDSIVLEDEDYIWDLSVADDGTVYLGTGGNGRVYRFHDGTAEQLFDSPENDILSVLEDTRGEIWVGCSPDGLIYRLREDGSVEQEFRTGQSSVWCMAQYQNGVIAGTGPEGKVFYCERGKKARELAETSAVNVMSVLPLPDDELLIAGESPGVLQRIGTDGVVFTVAQFDYEETRSLRLIEPDSLAFIALGPGAGAKRARAVIMTGQTSGPFQEVWASPDSLLLELSDTQDGLVAAGGWPGRAYVVSDETAYVRIGEIGRAQVLCTGSYAGTLYFGSGSPACLYWQKGDRVSAGQWTSSALDAEAVATWGRAALIGFGSDKVMLECRSGNLREPGAGWSPWVEGSAEGDEWDLGVPDARYLQIRLTVREPARRGIPPVELLDVSYQPRNREPHVTKLNLLPKGRRPPGVYKSYSIPASTAIRAPSDPNEPRTGSIPDKEPPTTDRYLAWEAEDPDGDRMRYQVWMRRYPSGEWISLAHDLEETYWALTEGSLAEGWYSFRLEVQDDVDNPPSRAAGAARGLGPVLIDDIPPRVANVDWRSTNEGLIARIQVVDNGSGIVQASVSVDGRSWQVLEPEDGVADSERELFSVRLQSAHASISVRLKDRAGNVVSQSLPIDR